MPIAAIPTLAAASFIDPWIAPYHLQQPLALLLLPVILLAGWLAWRRRLPSLIVPAIGPFRDGHSRLGATGRFSWLRLPLALECLALAVLTIALARPQYGSESIERHVQGIDIMLAIDISGSMDDYDIPEYDSLTNQQLADGLRTGVFARRIDIARREIQRFVDMRPNDRLGLVAFAGYPYIACPPTLDHDFLKGRVEQLDASMFQRDSHTNIAGPIASATTRLRDSPARRRVMVLFTDGRNTRETHVTPEEAAGIAAEFDIVIHTVGIGSDHTYALRNGRFYRQRGTYDQPLLAAIASATDGKFFEARDAEGFSAVMNAIDALEKVEIEQSVYVDYQELFVPWLWTGLGLLLLAFVLESTVLLKVP